MFVDRRVTAEKCVQLRSICTSRALITFYKLFSTSFLLSSLLRSYNNTIAMNEMNERKKISFWSIYATVCIYHAFLFNIIFFFISWALFCFLLTSQFSSARQIVHTLARAEISRLVRNLLIFVLYIFLKSIFLYLLQVNGNSFTATLVRFLPTLFLFTAVFYTFMIFVSDDYAKFNIWKKCAKWNKTIDKVGKEYKNWVQNFLPCCADC